MHYSWYSIHIYIWIWTLW